MDEAKARTNLFTLSPELRNQIYELVLVPQQLAEGSVDGCTAIWIGHYSNEDNKCQINISGPARYGWHTSWASPPALSQVSRRVRQESLPIYFGLNHFVTVVDGDYDRPRDFGGFGLAGFINNARELQVKQLLKWLVAMGRHNIKLVKQVHVLVLDGWKNTMLNSHNDLFMKEELLRFWLRKELHFNKRLSLPDTLNLEMHE